MVHDALHTVRHHPRAVWHIRRACRASRPRLLRDWHLSRALTLDATLGGSVYNIGDIATLTAAFTIAATGTAANPTTTVITVRAPDGTESTPAVSNPSTGSEQAQVSLTLAGEWLWRAVGTGAVQAAGQGAFYVTPNSF